MSSKKKIAQILQDHNYEYESEYNISKIRKQFYNKALDLKKKQAEPSHTNHESLEKNYLNFKSIINDLRDYEVS